MKPEREPDGQWITFQHWVNYATRDIGGMNAACYDAKGRRCRIGKDFMLAEEEGRFLLVIGMERGKLLKNKKIKKAAQATLKANFPWRIKMNDTIIYLKTVILPYPDKKTNQL